MLTVLILIDFESLTYWKVFVLTLLSAASLLLESPCYSFAMLSTFAFKWWCCSFMAVVLQKDLCNFWRTWCVNIFRSRCAKWDCWYHANFFEISTILACTWCLMQSLEKCLPLHLRSRNVELRLCNWLSGKPNHVHFCLPFNFAFTSSHHFLCSSLTRRIFSVCVM